MHKSNIQINGSQNQSQLKSVNTLQAILPFKKFLFENLRFNFEPGYENHIIKIAYSDEMCVLNKLYISLPMDTETDVSSEARSDSEADVVSKLLDGIFSNYKCWRLRSLFGTGTENAKILKLYSSNPCYCSEEENAKHSTGWKSDSILEVCYIWEKNMATPDVSLRTIEEGVNRFAGSELLYGINYVVHKHTRDASLVAILKDI